MPHKLRSRLNQMCGEGSADLRRFSNAVTRSELICSSRHFIQSQEITVVMCADSLSSEWKRTAGSGAKTRARTIGTSRLISDLLSLLVWTRFVVILEMLQHEGKLPH